MTADIISFKNPGEWDTDLLDTLTKAARWEQINPLLAWRCQLVLFDDYDVRHGRTDFDFRLAATERAFDALLTMYDLMADDVRRKKLRTLFRQIISSSTFGEGGLLEEMAVHVKQRVEEHDFLAKHNCHDPDTETNA